MWSVCILFDKPVGDAATTQTEYFSLFISEFVKKKKKIYISNTDV